MKKILLTLNLLALSFMANAASGEKAFEALNKKGTNILVHVHASWCPTCLRQKQLLKKLPKDLQEKYELVEIDFDKDKKFLEKHAVSQQSMLITFKGGHEMNRTYGNTNLDNIEAQVSSAFQTELNTKLQEKRNASKVPQDKRAIMVAANKKLAESGIIDQAKNVGDQFIDFEVPNVHGKKVKISEALKKGPVVLTFYRGGWCPYCNLQLRAYQESLDLFEKAGGQLIAVSPESMDSAETTVNKNELKFEILTDDHNKVARQYGLVFKLDDDLKEIYLQFGLDLEKNQGNDSWELPIPATYVIDQKGVIRYAFLNTDYVQRAEPKDIIDTLLKLK